MHSLIHKLGVAAAAIASIGPTVAQDSYPNQPIKIIVPFSAGGGTDITARLLGDQLRSILRQSVVGIRACDGHA
jgi:tripartite-type tricarboxylate transporter receptor subunit TctC